MAHTLGKSGRCVLIILLGIIGAKSSFAKRQPLVKTRRNSVVVELHRAELQSFDSTLSVLSRQAAVSFVVEGTPLQRTLDGNNIPDLSGVTSLNNIVSRVAAAYDYNSQRHGKVFVWKKRYSNPADFPTVTMSECIHSLREIKRITEPFDPHVVVDRYSLPKANEKDPVIGELIASFTPIQLAALKRDGLRTASLSAIQQKLVHRFALYVILHESLDRAVIAQSWLQDAEKEVVFRWGSEGTRQHLFGFEMPEGPARHRYFEPLSGPYAVDDTFFAINIYPAASPNEADLTAPKNSPAEPVPFHFTFGEIAQKWSSEKQTGTTVSIDPGLGDKDVTLIAKGPIPPGQLAQALAECYGLRCIVARTAETQKLTMTYPVCGSARNAADLPRALTAALPEPLQRSLHIAEAIGIDRDMQKMMRGHYSKVSATETAEDPASGETPAIQREEIQKRYDANHFGEIARTGMARVQALSEEPTTLRVVAVTRLRASIESKLPPQGAYGTPFHDIPSPAKDDFAYIIFAEYLKRLFSIITHSVPDFLSKPDEVIVKGDLTGGPSSGQLFALSLWTTDPYGKIEETAELHGVRYVK
jgi:hypothetical protein